MITENDVLLILHNDPWFKPSGSERKKTIVDNDGNQIEVAESYYNTIDNTGQVIIRVSNHGTALRTWIKREDDPSQSIQNLSVIFSNEPVSSNRLIEPVKMQDKNGNIVNKYKYFVVEQYVYRMDALSKKDFLSFLKKIKALDNSKVFKDLFRKKPTKKAQRTVLEPDKEDGTPVPPSTNTVHPRQRIVAQNKDYEIDAQGDIIKDSRKRRKVILESTIRRIVSEELSKYYYRSV